MSNHEMLLTLKDWMRWSASRFYEAELTFGHGTSTAFEEAIYLVLHAVKLPPDTPENWWDTRVTAEEASAILVLIQQRIDTRRPASYLTGQAIFAGLPFFVDERVLVPRSPIAELIEAGFHPWVEPGQVHRILDLCTGSGCIGLASAYALPHAQVDLSDISEGALEVASINRERLGLSDDQVRIIQSDLFDALQGEKYDLIVTNPPYVDAEEMAQLTPEYRHEPSLGLAAGEAGLDIALKILAESPEHLTDQGVLIMEVGNSAYALEECLPQVPFTWIEFERGGHGVLFMTREELLSHRDELRKLVA